MQWLQVLFVRFYHGSGLMENDDEKSEDATYEILVPKILADKVILKDRVLEAEIIFDDLY